MQIELSGVDEETSDLIVSLTWVSKRPGWKVEDRTASNGRLEFRRSLGMWSLNVTHNGYQFREVMRDPTRLQLALFEIIFPVKESDDAE